jgi:hypothetical protein
MILLKFLLVVHINYLCFPQRPALGGSSSVSIDDLWPEINSVEGVGCVVATMTATCGHLDASASCPMSDTGATTKGTTVAGSKDLRNDSGFRQASEQVLDLKKNRGCGSVKDKVVKILAASEAGTFGDLPPRTRDSFLERRYSPSTGMESNEWEIILEQLLVMGLIVKHEVVSDDDD